MSRVTWYPPVQGHGIQLISLNAGDGFPVPKSEEMLYAKLYSFATGLPESAPKSLDIPR